MERRRLVIIGAGPTGLGAAWRLRELGERDFVVLDAAPEPGGLARSFRDERGFTWDLGGHVLFSHYPYFDAALRAAVGDDGWYHHQREAWARMYGAWVPYPVQNNLRHLPREVLLKCVLGLVRASRGGAGRPENFAQWIDATFGAGLAEVFMRPYNFKVWAYPPESMGWSWIGERVAVTELERVLTNVLLEKDDVSWGPNNTFQFPKEGGTGGVWRAVAKRVGPEHLRLGARVSAVDTQRRVVTLSDGEELRYDALISTMPIDRLLSVMEPRDELARTAASRLVHSSTHVVGLGLQGNAPPSLATKCWMYFPEGNTPFYRATVFSNYSPAHVPDPKRYWSLMTETSESPQKPVLAARLVEDTIQGAIASGLIESRAQVASVWAHRMEYGYPTPSLERDAHLARVMPALEEKNVFSRGRFGAWKYEVSNQDHSFMQGVEVVNRLLLQERETTLVSGR
ncbi:MAG: FAD-dependent oxidoreductase [Archangium sp.]|nr:FAD-dependent oxidoreductase [Archangium sp.]